MSQIVRHCNLLLFLLLMVFSSGCGGGGGAFSGLPDLPLSPQAASIGGLILVPVDTKVSAPEKNIVLNSLVKRQIADGFKPLVNALVTLDQHTTRTNINGYYSFVIRQDDRLLLLQTKSVELLIKTDGDKNFRLSVPLAEKKTVIQEVHLDLDKQKVIAVLEEQIVGLPPRESVEEIAILWERDRTLEPELILPTLIEGTVNLDSVEISLSDQLLTMQQSQTAPWFEWHSAIRRYVIHNPPTGEVKLAFSRSGYTTVIKQVVVRTGVSLSNVDAQLFELQSFQKLQLQIRSGNHQIGRAGLLLDNPIILRVVNSAGVPVAGVPVHAEPVGATAGVVDFEGVTAGIQQDGFSDEEGILRCEKWTLGSDTGELQLLFSLPQTSSETLFVTATALPGLPFGLKSVAGIHHNSGELVVDSTRSLQVQVVDQWNHGVPATDVYFYLQQQPDSGASLLLPQKILTNSEGFATNLLALSEKSGIHQIRITSSVTEEVELIITGLPDAPDRFTTSTEGINAIAGSGTLEVSFVLEDRFGNKVADGYEVSLTLLDPTPANQTTLPALVVQSTTQNGVVSGQFNPGSMAGDNFQVQAIFDSVQRDSALITVVETTANQLRIEGPLSVTAGNSFALTRITAMDTFGNPDTSLNGVKALHFSGAATSVNGNQPVYPATATFVKGVAENITLQLFNSESLTLQVDMEQLTGTLTGLMVQPALLAAYRVTTPLAVVTDGLTLFEATVNALDSFGNITVGNAAVTLLPYLDDLATPGAGTLVSSNSTHDLRSGSLVISDLTYNRNENFKIRASDADGIISSLANTAVISTSPGNVVSYQITTPVSATAGQSFTIILTALDAAGNRVLAANQPVQLSLLSGASGVANGGGILTGTLQPQLSNGQVTVSDVVYTKAEIVRIQITDSQIINTSVPFTVNPTTVNSLLLSAGSSVTAGDATALTITALDIYNNVATAYTGNHQLVFAGASLSPDGMPPSVSDGGAVEIPLGTITVLPFVNGISNTMLNVKLAGEAPSLTVVDQDTPALTNNTNPLVFAPVVAAALAHYQISVVQPISYKANFTMSVSARDAFGNQVVGAANVVLSHTGTGVLHQTAMDVSSGLIQLTDQTYNKIETITLSASDGTINTASPPAVTILAAAENQLIFPPDNSAQKSKSIEYNLGETAQSGRIVWLGISGPDAAQTHEYLLSGAELLAGPHSIDLTLSVTPPLVSETVYQITVESNSLATGYRAREIIHQNVFYTTALPIDPNPAHFAYSNRGGSVTVVADGAAPVDHKLRIYLNNQLVGETQYLGVDGLSTGNTPFLGIVEQTPGTTIHYALVNKIPGYALGVESNRISDGLVPQPPAATAIYSTLRTNQLMVDSSINGQSNLGSYLKLYVSGAAAGLYKQSLSFVDDNPLSLNSGDFTPTANLQAGSAISYTITDQNQNESTLVADGVIPQEPMTAWLPAAAFGADNTLNYINIASTPAPLVMVTPVNGQTTEEQLFVEVDDGVAKIENLGLVGIANSTNGSNVSVPLVASSGLAEGPLTVRCYTKNSVSGHESIWRVGTPGINDRTRPVISQMEFYDTTEFDDREGFVDQIHLLFSEIVDTASGLPPTSLHFGSITLPDGQTADLSTAIFTDPAGITQRVEIHKIIGQLVPNTDTALLEISGIAMDSWKDLAGNRNDLTVADSETKVDLAAPVILEVASDNNLNVGDWVNSGTTFTLDFSEDVKIGSAYDPWSLMSVFANVDDVNIVWTDGGAGNPDLLDDAPIASSISGGNILLNFTSDTNAFGNWTEGFDAFNILSNPVGNFFEDVSGNDILKYPSDWEIIWP